MSDSATADAAPAVNQATPEQTSWLRSFLGSGDPQKPNFFDQASSAVSGAVTKVENSAKELYHEAGAAVDKVENKAKEIYHEAGAAVEKAEGKAKQLAGEAGEAIKAIPQKFSEAGEAITDWRKHNIGVFESERKHTKTGEELYKEQQEAIAEMQRREKLRVEAENDYWKKVNEEQLQRMRDLREAEAARKQREEDDRKAAEEEYAEIRRRLQPVTAGIDPTPHPHRKH